MHLLYYVTTHGYGHGVRTAAICNALAADVRITFRTALPEQFFREEVRRDFVYAPASFDCGCLQSDSVHTDIERTLSTYRAIAGTNESLLDKEVRWCRQQRVDVIASDITPFAFEVAQRSAVPSVAVTNFTWYDIYAPYAASNPGFLPVLDAMKAQYARASLVLALQPALPMSFFRRRIDVPPVGRIGHERRAEIVEKYRFDPRKHVGLVYFGQFGIQGIDWRKLAEFADWEFLGIWPLDGAPPNYHFHPEERFPLPGFGSVGRYHDLQDRVRRGRGMHAARDADHVSAPR